MASVSNVREGLSTGAMVVVPLALCSKAHNPISPNMTLVHSEPLFLPQDPANKILCIGPLRGCQGFWETLISHWQMKSPLIFTARCYVGSSSQQWSEGRGAQCGVVTLCLSGGTFVAKILLPILNGAR